MNDLFTASQPAHAGVPLAERMRPHTIAEVVGQKHLLAPGKPLAVAFASGKLHSMILWGPPGVGKTTLARLMADAFNAEFIALSAVLSGVKDIRDAVARAEATLAQSGRATILFVDEVHRFNKAQQDAFLPYRRTGHGDVHRRDHRESRRSRSSARCCRARRSTCWSRCRADDLGTLLDRALAPRRRAALDAPARDALIAYADGDGRRLINLVEQLAVAAVRGQARSVDLAFVEADDRAQPAPLRQGRRGVLRPDLRAAQGGARLRSRRVAVLDVPDARRRRRSAVRRAPRDPDGERGHRPRRSTRIAHGARRGGSV
jgi:putative ATPase